MRRALQLLKNARERNLAKPGYADFEKNRSDWDLSLAARCYLENGSDPTPPINWPWSAKNWKPSPDRKKQLIKAGCLVMATFGSQDPEATTEEKETDFWACLRELERLLPPLAPARPSPQRDGWLDAPFDKTSWLECKERWACTQNHATFAATIGMHPEHLQPYLPEGPFNTMAVAKTLDNLGIPFAMERVKLAMHEEPLTEYGMIRYVFELRGKPIRGQRPRVSCFLGYTRSPDGQLMVCFPDTGWEASGFESVGLIGYLVDLKAEGMPWASEIWTLYL